MSAFIFGIGLIFFGASRSIWFSLPMMLVTGWGMMVQMAASNTMLQTVVEESKRGRVMGLFLMAFAGMMPFGSLFGGFMAERFGAPLTLECGGVACCLGALLFLRALPEINRVTDPLPG
jgi:MFS family permease